MSNAGKIFLGFVGVVLVGVVWVFSRRLSKSSDTTETINDRLAKAREAKLAKSILKKSENENTQNSSDSEFQS
jgi:hypothetical protein